MKETFNNSNESNNNSMNSMNSINSINSTNPMNQVENFSATNLNVNNYLSSNRNNADYLYKLPYGNPYVKNINNIK